MTRHRKSLYAATAAGALLVGFSSGAGAFEVVDWTWTNDTTSTIDIDVDIDDVLDPQGLIQVEKLQMHFGNLNATATVNGVDNMPALNGTGTGTVTLDEDIVLNGTYIDGPPDNVADDTDTVTDDGDNPIVVDLTGGDLTEDGNSFALDLNLSGEFEVTDVVVDGELDAIDLPKVENAATAVANNQSITGDVPIYLHDAQFAAGAINPVDGGETDDPNALAFLLGAWGVTILDDQLEDINEHTAIAALLTVGAATGFIEPASITASASVSDILNAYVENSATAVANNASYTIETDNLQNHILVADLTQWSYANVNAQASVTDVDINGYTGFGAAGLGGGLNPDIVPVVSNVATAVGNNLSINVGVPDSE